MGLAVSNCQLGVRRRCRTMHRLQQEMFEFQVLVQVRLGTALGKNKLQFVAAAKLQWCSRLWAHADPVDAWRRHLGTIRLNRDVEADRMKGVNQWLVELE